MSPLVDTNVLSELFRPRPDPGVVRWAESLTDIRLSVITIDELWYGLTRKPGERLVTSVETFLDTRCEVLPVTSEIAKQSGVLRARLTARGRPSTQADMLLAATALVHGLTLVTRNTHHFQGCPIALMDPFQLPGE